MALGKLETMTTRETITLLIHLWEITKAEQKKKSEKLDCSVHFERTS